MSPAEPAADTDSDSSGARAPWRVLALPPLPVAALQAMLPDPRLELVLPSRRTQAEVDALLPEVDLVLGDWTRSVDLTDPGPRVCFVQQPSVGYDRVDVEAFAAAGVPVSNCAGANATSVAEWVVGATLAVHARLAEGDAAVRRGEWPQTSLGGRELAGSTVGLVGMGPVGRAVAPRLAALGCDVGYWSRTAKPDAPARFHELDELLALSDVVVLVIALGPGTRGLLSAARLALMRPGAVLVNAARGAVVDEAALVAALRDGRLGGAALDVYEQEPLPADSPLRALPRVLLTPHLAGSSRQATAAILQLSTANLKRVVDGVPVVDVVNGVDPGVRRRR